MAWCFKNSCSFKIIGIWLWLTKCECKRNMPTITPWCCILNILGKVCSKRREITWMLSRHLEDFDFANNDNCLLSHKIKSMINREWTHGTPSIRKVQYSPFKCFQLHVNSSYHLSPCCLVSRFITTRLFSVS